MLDTSQSYLPLRRGSSDEDDFEQSPPLEKQPQHSPPMRWKDILLIISGVTNLAALCLILSYLFFFSSFSSSSPAADDYPASTKCSAATTAYPQTSYTGIHTYPEKWQPATWWSMYSIEHENQTAAVDAAWEAMVPAHGIIAVDKSWAEQRQLPLSMELPSDHTKQVYILEAYHMLHCLTIMRKTFYQLARNETLSYPAMHASHCFDAIRQHVMCVADDTPLYTWGQNIAGDGQLRKCRNWDKLRDWAGENSACYADFKDRDGGRFDACDEGTDGIVLQGEVGEWGEGEGKRV